VKIVGHENIGANPRTAISAFLGKSNEAFLHRHRREKWPPVIYAGGDVKYGCARENAVVSAQARFAIFGGL
jgi:hypothetical protein